MTSFWTVNFGTTVTRRGISTTTEPRAVHRAAVYRTVIVRTILVAASRDPDRRRARPAVAFFMAKVARPAVAKFMVVAVADAAVGQLPRQGVRLAGDDRAGRRARRARSAGRRASGLTAVVITLAYLWLPFMVLPVYAGFERLPDSLLEASSDLGAKPGAPCASSRSRWCFRLSSPVRSSRSRCRWATTSPSRTSAGRRRCSATWCTTEQATDIPFAAALATVSVVIMAIYLTLIRRSGALDNL